MSEQSISDIRDGKVWVSGDINIAIGAGSLYYIGITSLNVFTRLVESSVTNQSSDLLVTLYKNEPYSGGTPKQPATRNQRNSAAQFIAPMTVSSGVTPDGVLSDANIIGRIPVRASNQTPKNETQNSDYDIIFLEKNTDYLVALENRGGGNADADLLFTLVSEESLTA